MNFGQPGCGKSTALLAALSAAGLPTSPLVREGLVAYHALEGGRLVVLGDYSSDALFPGVDRLSHSVPPHARVLAAAKLAAGATVVFEGDRLFNSKMIQYCLDHQVPHLFVVLAVDGATLAAQRAQRGTPQRSSWLDGRATMLANIQSKFLFVQTVTPAQLHAILTALLPH